MSSFRGLLVGVLLLSCVRVSGAQKRPEVLFPSESRDLGSRISDVRSLIQRKQWPLALEALRELLEKPSQLVPLSKTRLVDHRRICQSLLCQLPQTTMANYRRTLDARLEQKLSVARKNRDRSLLREIVHNSFCSRSAEQALVVLGELAFEAGEFHEALRWWRLLIPPLEERHSKSAVPLTYPDPSIAKAELHAKQLLAKIFLRASTGTTTPKTSLDAYRKAYPNARGRLAGREGLFVEILGDISKEKQALSTPVRDWPTFAGDATRNAPPNDHNDLGILCRRATWTWELNEGKRIDLLAHPPWKLSRDAAAELSFFPIVRDGKAYVADSSRLLEFDLRTGESAIVFEGSSLWEGLAPRLPIRTRDMEYTLSSGRGCLFLRQGRTEVGGLSIDLNPAQPKAVKDRVKQSLVACLRVAPKFPTLWWVRGLDLDRAVFEGSPLVVGNRVYVAATRVHLDRTLTTIYCYSAAPHGDGPQPALWKRDVCQTRELRADRTRTEHHLLALAGPNVVYQSHSGAVVALDRFTGTVAWARRFEDEVSDEPRLIPGHEGEPTPIDLLPPMYASGRVYLADRASRKLYSLSVATGETLWERSNASVVQLLGVGHGNLIFMTSDGLRAVNATTGTDDGGWQMPDSGMLPPVGRGILLGDLVLWPTSRGVFPIRQSDGRIATNPTALRNVPPGNLLYANGVLLSAGPATLTAFVPPRWTLEEAKREVGQRPDSAEANLRLALAQLDANPSASAEQSLQRADENAIHVPFSWERDRLAREIEETRQRSLLKRAGEFVSDNKPEDAEALLSKSPSIATARFWEAHHEPARALRVWHQVLLEGATLDEQIEADEAISRLLHSHGRDLYADHETKAIERFPLDGLGREQLDELLAAYPHSLHARRALRRAIEQHRKANRPGLEAWAIRRLMRANPDDSTLQAELRKTLRRYKLDEEASEETPLYQRQATIHLDRGESALECLAALSPRTVLITSISQGNAHQVRARTIPSGEVRWEQTLGFTPTWCDDSDEMIALGGPTGVAGLRRVDGRILWQRGVEQGTRLRKVVVRGEVICLFEDRSTFLALDAHSGRVLWSKSSPNAKLGLPFPYHGFFNAYVMDTTVWLRSSGKTSVYDLSTGNLLRENRDGEYPWILPPTPWGDDGVLFARNLSTIEMYDVRKQTPRWRFALPEIEFCSGEAPAILASPEALLVVIPTNIGYQLQRLDPETGKPLWSRAPILDIRASTDLTRGVIVRGQLALVEKGSVVVRSLEDGRRLTWFSPQNLPSSTRFVRVGGAVLVAPPPNKLHFRFRWLNHLLQWDVIWASRDGQVQSLWLLDLEERRIVQRMNLTVRPFSNKRTRSTDHWQILPRTKAESRVGEQPFVRLLPSGLLVSMGETLWIYQNRPPAD